MHRAINECIAKEKTQSIKLYVTGFAKSAGLTTFKNFFKINRKKIVAHCHLNLQHFYY